GGGGGGGGIDRNRIPAALMAGVAAMEIEKRWMKGKVRGEREEEGSWTFIYFDMLATLQFYWQNSFSFICFKCYILWEKESSVYMICVRYMHVAVLQLSTVYDYSIGMESQTMWLSCTTEVYYNMISHSITITTHRLSVGINILSNHYISRKSTFIFVRKKHLQSKIWTFKNMDILGTRFKG
ncbi:hypothetical protein ACJX0J_028182, partial [Zea mays]